MLRILFDTVRTNGIVLRSYSVKSGSSFLELFLFLFCISYKLNLNDTIHITSTTNDY
jgi:hypothetical protein